MKEAPSLITEGENVCCKCKRQNKIDKSAWIYCEWLKFLLDIPTFDETGETMGCTYFED